MVEITDAYMEARLNRARPYSLALLTAGPAYQPPDTRSAGQAAIVREHGRRNMQLQAEGKMALVGPLAGKFPVVGICIFTVPEAEARSLMDGDGAVQAGVFTYDLLTLYGFPGDGLPAD